MGDSSSAVKSTTTTGVVADTSDSDIVLDNDSKEEDDDDVKGEVKDNGNSAVESTPAADVAIKIVSWYEKDMWEIYEGVEIEVEKENKKETRIYDV